jgi:hypothetical protein
MTRSSDRRERVRNTGRSGTIVGDPPPELRTSRSASAAEESKFIQGALAAIPAPADHQFPTPESVVRAFIVAVSANDLDEAMKCFPIREAHAKQTWQLRASGIRTFIGKDAYPDDGLFQFTKALDRFRDYWLRLYVLRLVADGRMKPELLYRNTYLSEEPAQRQQQLEELQRQFREGLSTPMRVVSWKPARSLGGEWPGAEGLGGTDATILQVNVMVGTMSTELEFGVFKMGSNYRIEHIGGT